MYTSDVFIGNLGEGAQIPGGCTLRMQIDIQGLPTSPVLAINGQRVAAIEAPMQLRRAELQAMIERCHR